MNHFTIYTNDGNVIKTGFNTTENVVVPTNANILWDERVDPEVSYVDLSGTEPVVADRMTMAPVVTSTTGQATISGLPDPCIVIWQNQRGDVIGGEATITFDEPGTKRLVIRAEPMYLDHELEVEIP